MLAEIHLGKSELIINFMYFITSPIGIIAIRRAIMAIHNASNPKFVE